MGEAANAAPSTEKLRELGAALHEITAALRDLGPGRSRRWFQGPVYADLIVDFVDDALTRFELTFEGQWLAVERESIATGRTDERTADSVVPVSKLVTRDAASSAGTIAAAREVLSSLCDAELRDALLAMLRG
jgi:hypothetical protein